MELQSDHPPLSWIQHGQFCCWTAIYTSVLRVLPRQWNRFPSIEVSPREHVSWSSCQLQTLGRAQVAIAALLPENAWTCFLQLRPWSKHLLVGQYHIPNAAECSLPTLGSQKLSVRIQHGHFSTHVRLTRCVSWSHKCPLSPSPKLLSSSFSLSH